MGEFDCSSQLLSPELARRLAQAALDPLGFLRLAGLNAALAGFGDEPVQPKPKTGRTREPCRTSRDEPEKAASAASAASAEPDRDICPCGAPMRSSVDNLYRTCEGCARIVEKEPDDDEAHTAPSAARLRLVGPGSSLLQPDLYRSGAGCTAESQRKQIVEEFHAYHSIYVEDYKHALPLDACSLAANLYNDVQRRYVKRSQNKKAIMAACYYLACIELGHAPPRAKVAMLMQLPSKGIARGLNFLRTLAAAGDIDTNVNPDPCVPEITSLFASLGLADARFAKLRGATAAIVRIAVEHNIATQSVLRSKVAGAAFMALRRCQDTELLPRPVSLQQFCETRIRKNTLSRVLQELVEYHSHFVPTYRAEGLFDGVLPAAALR